MAFNFYLNRSLLLTSLLVSTFVNANSITIDGKLDEALWQQGQVINQFVTTFPYSLEKPEYETQVMMLSNEQGIYIGVINTQPQETQISTRTRKDEYFEADFNNIIIDFDHNGSNAYQFSISNGGSMMDGTYRDENQFSRDWNGIWYAKTSADQQHWYAEMFIPWGVAPMSTNEKAQRQIGLHIERYVAASQKTYANQPISTSRQRFLSEIKTIAIDDHASDSLQSFVSVTGRNDRITSDTTVNVGLDVFYKPDSSKQLSVTLNPDFGHVDSDNLVVNFSPTETFFSENRPFFTENQSLFTLNGQENMRLIHTRRIGAKPDSGENIAAEIKGAVKFTNTDEQSSYGVFAAFEDDTELAKGRNYYAGRYMHKTDNYKLGYLVTLTERAAIERNALTQALDYGYFINDTLSLSGQLVNSNIDQFNQSTSGNGGFISLSYQPSQQWRNFWSVTYLDNNLQLNDLGFLPRNNLRSLAYQNSYSDYDFNANSQFQEHKVVTDVIYKENNEGFKLVSSIGVTDIWRLKDSSSFQWQVKIEGSAYDDLQTRGNNPLALKQAKLLDLLYFGESTGSFRYHLHSTFFDNTVGGQGHTVHAHPSYYFNDNYSLTVGLWHTRADHWLLWQTGNYLQSYRREEFKTNINFNAIIDEKQEFNLKFQWIALSAQAERAYQVDATGQLLATKHEVNSFSISDAAIQLRYRYEIAPLSNVYLVYSRGGRAVMDEETSLGSLFSPGWEKRDGDSLSVKVRYQF